MTDWQIGLVKALTPPVTPVISTIDTALSTSCAMTKPFALATSPSC